jgi:hypothetical protein
MVATKTMIDRIVSGNTPPRTRARTGMTAITWTSTMAAPTWEVRGGRMRLIRISIWVTTRWGYTDVRRTAAGITRMGVVMASQLLPYS